MPGYQFTDNQNVEAPASEDPKVIVSFVEKCIAESNLNRNRFAPLTGSYLQDADKCDQLYHGHLYSKRQKKEYECKPDSYAYYVDFNALLLMAFDYKEEVRSIDDGDKSSQSQALDALSMSRIIQYCNKKNRTPEKEEDMLRFSGIHGNGVDEFQPYTDEDGRSWPGYDTFHPKYFGISAGATDVDDAFFVYKRIPVPVAELKQAFPDFSEQIKPDPEISLDTADSDTSTGFSAIFSGIGQGVRVGSDNMRDGAMQQHAGKNAWLTKLYFRDPTRIKISTEEDLDGWINSNSAFGGKIAKLKVRENYLRKMASEVLNGGMDVKKYPFGRRISVACKLRLEDVANPYPWFPYSITKCYRKPKEAWAKGVIHKIREPIQNMQMILAGSAANTDYRQRASYVVTGPSTLENKLKKVPMLPNSVTYIGPVGSKLEAVPVPTLGPQDAISLAEIRRRDAEMTGGLESVLGGVNPAGVYSGLQFEKTLEQARGKVKPRYQELSRTRQRRGEWFLWFIQNFMTDERKLEFMTETEGNIFMTINKMVMDGNQVQYENDVTRGKFHYTIDIGLNLPMTVQERMKQAQEAAELMMPFAPALATEMKLRAMDMPGKYEIIQKFKEAVKSKEEEQARAMQNQMLMQKEQMDLQKNKMERELDVKEVEAGAKVQEAGSWVLSNFMDALGKHGFAVPKEVMESIAQEMGIAALETSEKVSGDAHGE